MQYFGGKYRIASKLVDPIHDLLRTGWYARFVDLFCGSMNVTHRVKWNHRLANDLNPYTIAVYQHAINGGTFPEEITEEEYQEIKENKDDYPDWLVGFVGFGCSFSGKFFGGYARCAENKSYAAVAGRSIQRKLPGLEGDLALSCADYRDVTLYDTDLVYCDIPYEGTTGYSVGEFDHDVFYRWVDEQDCVILVSEYHENARGEIIWSKESKKSIRNADDDCEPTTEILQAFNVPDCGGSGEA